MSKFSYPLNIYSIFVTFVLPFACNPAKTVATPPLKSVHFTLAADNFYDCPAMRLIHFEGNNLETADDEFDPVVGAISKPLLT